MMAKIKRNSDNCKKMLKKKPPKFKSSGTLVPVANNF